MAKPAKPPERPSPFNALLEMRRQPTGQTSGLPDVQTAKPSDIRSAAGLAKSMNPEFMKFTTYIRKKTHRAIKVKLTEQDREMSDLVEELLSAWLQKDSHPVDGD